MNVLQRFRALRSIVSGHLQHDDPAPLRVVLKNARRMAQEEGASEIGVSHIARAARLRESLPDATPVVSMPLSAEAKVAVRKAIEAEGGLRSVTLDGLRRAVS